MREETANIIAKLKQKYQDDPEAVEIIENANANTMDMGPNSKYTPT